MNIIWLGHGSFRIETGGQVLLIDPWLTGNPVLPEDQHEEAVAGGTHFLLTHCHFDHVADLVPLTKKLGIPAVGQYDVMGHFAEKEGIDTIGFNKGGTVDLNGVKVSMVPASHSSTFSTPDGPRTGGSEVGYMIQSEGHTVYVSGDTDIMADMDWMGDYYKPDIGILSAPAISMVKCPPALRIGWGIITNPISASSARAGISPWIWRARPMRRNAISISRR